MILAATGLLREGRILAGQGIRPLAGGGDPARLLALLDRWAREADGIISIGLCGALSPRLRPGDWVVAEAVLDGDERHAVDGPWASRLMEALPGAAQGMQVGQDGMLTDAAGKAALHQATGALGVDMESHVAARVALRHDLPFAVARVVSDDAGHDLPPAAEAGMRRDGGMDLAAVLRSLARDPRQLPALIRTGWHAERAFRELLRGHHRLGPGLAGPAGAGDAGLV
ncbi:hopanoid-associated phosphorylase [Pseudoroseomonas globiformis]|uniref:Hopanoid-associated phosphorylase n=1 Tax=Teichococcus globiformis TaxID=2307229 RepID=A0ABV7G055_9PROT